MHMPLEQGTHRDILVIRAVRNAVGPEATILIDANNGYNLNLTKQVLSETAEAKVYWMEEAFHEDGSFYANLKEWLNAEGIGTKIADGEGGASLNLLQWAEEGLVDIIQYDIFHPGFSRWLELGPPTRRMERRFRTAPLRRALRQLCVVSSICGDSRV